MMNGRTVRREDCVCCLSSIEVAEFQAGRKPKCKNHQHIDRQTAEAWSVKKINNEEWARWVGPHHVELRKVFTWSPCGITATECQQNAGIGSEGAIRRARAKVEAYRGIQ